MSDILEGKDYDRSVWLFRIGFDHDQISEALNLHPGTVRKYLSAFRSNPHDIIEEHLKGTRSAHEIARRTGYSPTYVYRILGIHGMKAHINVAEPLTEEQKADVLRRYQRGESVPIISDVTGASIGQVKYLVQANRQIVGYR
jgi:DNA-binding NarL/FixJ family response regulator